MTEPVTNGLKMEELFEEITHVIQKHFRKNMGDFMQRYELLEQTHQQLMKLPSVVNELQLKTINTQNTTNLTEKNNQESSKKEDIVKASITTVCENENIQFIIKEEPKTKTSSYTQPIILSDDEEESSDEEEEEVEEEEEEEEEEEVEEEEVVEEEVEEEEEDEEDELEDEVETEAEEESDDEEETLVQPPLLKVEVEEEEELFEIEIDDVTYCTNNDETGFIYELSEDGDVGEKVGYFKDSEPFFYADE